MDTALLAALDAILGFCVMGILILLCTIIANAVRWFHDRRIIHGKLNRQMRQRLEDYVKREQVEW